MYARGLDKGDELEADRLGVVIAARAGYDAYGLPAVLQTLQAMNAQDSALALMFKTHPAPGERLDRARARRCSRRSTPTRASRSSPSASAPSSSRK